MKTKAFFIVAAGLMLPSHLTDAATFTVISNADSGAGSLREAIDQANATAGSDSIHFDIPGEEVHTIALQTPLPEIIEPLILDAATQGESDTPLIVLNGQYPDFSQVPVLRISGGDTTVRGFAINRGRSHGIQLSGAGGNLVTGNIIGLDAAGATRTSNFGSGIHIIDSPDNTIGGDSEETRNIISGNSGHGIWVSGSAATGNTILGNRIGTDITGLIKHANNQHGVYLDRADGNTIGGTADGAGNLISGNGSNGVQFNSADNTVILGNTIGSDAAGGSSIGNSTGISVDGSSNQIGGTATGEANIIAHNRHIGVNVGFGSIGNSIRGNAIFGNTSIGIDLGGSGVTMNDDLDPDTNGGNNLQNFPELASATLSATETTVTGMFNSTADSTFTMDFYANRAPDSTGFGEGEEHLGSTDITTDASGNATVSVSLPPASVGRHITATATDETGNTSEFSRWVTASSTIAGQTFEVTITDDSGTGSLREAIENANASLGNDTVSFNIAGDGPHVIAPASPLPTITDPMIIDGTSQPGFSNEPIIYLDGSNSGFQTTLLKVTAGDSTIKGLGITLGRQDGIELSLGGDNIVQGNRIGLDADNAFAGNVRHGILILNSADNLIGGPDEGAGNVIAGNTGFSSDGVHINGEASLRNRVLGNFIGTDASGTLVRGNGSDGVDIENGASDNVIGGIEPGHANTIAHNRERGVLVINFGPDPIGNAIRGNSIHSNTGPGIQLSFGNRTNDEGDGDTGPNQRQNFPTITFASAAPGSVTLQGGFDVATLTDTTFQLDFYANQESDSGGNSEGLQYLGSSSLTTDAGGLGSFDETFPTQPIGRAFTVTATDPDGNTSEFSSAHNLDESTIPPIALVVENTNNEGTGSLRQAITASNTNPASGPNAISFAIPGHGPHVIELTEGLPPIVQPVEIDATKPGSAGTPVVEITRDSSLTFLSGSGLRILGGQTTVQGLSITGFGEDGILLNRGGDNVIRGNFIGVDTSGVTRKENARHGIAIIDSSNNLIGGTDPGQGNIISSRSTFSSDAIFLNDSTFSGDPTTFGNEIRGNFIGTDRSGTVHLGTGGAAVNIISTSDNTIANNTIANNGTGIRLQGGNRSVQNRISENLMYDNTTGGILLGFNSFLENDALDADDGENRLQNVPEITAATLNESNTVVSGSLHSLPDTEFTIEFFASQECDSSGRGEGAVFLGSISLTTDAEGNGTFNDVTLGTRAPGRVITSTATDPNGNTSQYSTCFNGTSTASGTTFTVINVDDAGSGSLRQAVLDVNSTPIAPGERHMVNFAIPGTGPHVIELQTALPAVVEPIVIDGTTQDGFNDAPVIELRGDNIGFNASGFDIIAGDSTVRSLAIGGFSTAGIRLSVGGSNLIEGNHIGLDTTGVIRIPNNRGIVIEDSADNTIGGDSDAARNLISGNSGIGVDITNESTSGNRVLGNWIGLDANGDAAGNNSSGVRVSNAPDNIIGGAAEAEGNIIGGNSAAGVEVSGSGFGTNTATGNMILGNRIGTDVSGMESRSNGGGGIVISGTDANTTINGNLVSGNSTGFGPGISINSSGNTVTGNLVGTDVSGLLPLPNAREGLVVGSGSFNQIGGESPGDGNTIAFNRLEGVRLNDFSGRGNSILGNSIFENDGIGINLGFDVVTANDEGDVDEGSNRLQNFPVITGATAGTDETTIEGSLNSLPSTAFRLEFFASQKCDPTGFGEGRKFLGSATVDTDDAGTASFNVTLPESIIGGGSKITATATDAEGNTSEFCECADAEVTIPGSTFTVVNLDDDGPGSLRQAILESNEAVSSGNSILFDIPSSESDPDGFFVIAPLTGLPPIINTVTIDGFSQEGAMENTLNQGTNFDLKIRLDGANATANFQQADAIQIEGSGSKIKGLMITSWTRGLSISGDENRVEGCAIGTDPTGTIDLQSSSHGIHLIAGADRNIIGGRDVGQRNLISGNGSAGIYLNGGSDNEILGNLIGTDATGTRAQQNGGSGVLIDGGSTGNVIGDTTGGGNVIAFNGSAGVDLGGGASVINHQIRGNSIFENNGLAINLRGSFSVDNNDALDADTGPNGLQNFPIISSATINADSTLVAGTLESTPDTSFLVDFYANVACDLSGNGEGRQYLGTVTLLTDASGTGSFNETLPRVALYDFITATATDPGGSTSEFSDCFEAEINASGLLVGNVNLPEGNPNGATTTDAVFTVSLDGPADIVVNFDFATIPGTAEAGTDFQTTSGSGTIPIGETSVEVVVPVIRDIADEPDETFTITLDNLSGARPLDTSGLATIENDDDPLMPDALFANEPFAYEPGSIGGRDGGTGWGEPWSQAFGNNVIEPGLEYNDPFGQRFDAQGNAVSGTGLTSSRSLEMPIGEPGSTVFVSFLGRAEGVSSGGIRLLGSEQIRVSIGKSFNQPNWGIQLHGISGGTRQTSFPTDTDSFLVLALEFGESTVEADLYVNPPLSGRPDTSDASVSSAPFSVDRIALGSNTSTTIDEINVGKTWSSVTKTFLPRLDIAGTSMAEGDFGTASFEFPVSLSEASDSPVQVAFAIDGRNATEEIDFTGGSGTLTFEPGTTSQTITVGVIGDTVPETDEFFSVGLSNPEGARLGASTALGTIEDDDTPPIIFANEVMLPEGGSGTATFDLFLSHPWDQPVSVEVTTADGTATAGSDYTAASGTVTFEPGVTRQSFDVQINNDDEHEACENFFFNLSNPSNGSLLIEGFPAQIVNDDFVFEELLKVGDQIQANGECLVILDFLTDPVVSDDGRIYVQALTDHCPSSSGLSAAASHREAPLISIDPDADQTDVYAFRAPGSTDPEDPADQTFRIRGFTARNGYATASLEYLFDSSWGDHSIQMISFNERPPRKVNEVDLGYVTQTNAWVTAIPTDYAGTDRYTYTSSDRAGGIETATVIVQVDDIFENRLLRLAANGAPPDLSERPGTPLGQTDAGGIFSGSLGDPFFVDLGGEFFDTLSGLNRDVAVPNLNASGSGYDRKIQSEDGKQFLAWNSTTGRYVYLNCENGARSSGTAETANGESIMVDGEEGSFQVRISATIENGVGSASVAISSSRTWVAAFVDSDVSNSGCECGPGSPIIRSAFPDGAGTDRRGMSIPGYVERGDDFLTAILNVDVTRDPSFPAVQTIINPIYRQPQDPFSSSFPIDNQRDDNGFIYSGVEPDNPPGEPVDLGINKTAEITDLANGLVTYMVTVRNHSTSATATGIEVTETGIFTITGASVSQGTFEGILWQVGSLGPSESATLTLETELFLDESGYALAWNKAVISKIDQADFNNNNNGYEVNVSVTRSSGDTNGRAITGPGRPQTVEVAETIEGIMRAIKDVEIKPGSLATHEAGAVAQTDVALIGLSGEFKIDVFDPNYTADIGFVGGSRGGSTTGVNERGDLVFSADNIDGIRTIYSTTLKNAPSGGTPPEARTNVEFGFVDTPGGFAFVIEGTDFVDNGTSKPDNILVWGDLVDGDTFRVEAEWRGDSGHWNNDSASVTVTEINNEAVNRGVPPSTFQGIIINGHKGDDIIRADGGGTLGIHPGATIDPTDITDSLYGVRISVNGGDGNDVISGGDSDDFLLGGPGNDIIEGERGNDVLFGETGNDDLAGGVGGDSLSGGGGDDLLRTDYVPGSSPGTGRIEDTVLGPHVSIRQLPDGTFRVQTQARGDLLVSENVDGPFVLLESDVINGEITRTNPRRFIRSSHGETDVNEIGLLGRSGTDEFIVSGTDGPEDEADVLRELLDSVDLGFSDYDDGEDILTFE